ncbi:phospholipid-transporting ATPase IK-like isoform 1-T1 [Morphnus guianensis]
MAEQDRASGCLHGKKQLPAFTWEVRANDRNYHMQFKKKFAFCLTKKKYAGNAIKTAKYNIFTFLPLNLYEQFHRMANVYFVFVILLQTFPEISTLPWYTLLFPLSCLLTIRGLRDLIDDIVSMGWSKSLCVGCRCWGGQSAERAPLLWGELQSLGVSVIHCS